MAVNSIKKQHIKKASKIFLYLNKMYKYDIRFDVVEVYICEGKCKITHLKNIM